LSSSNPGDAPAHASSELDPAVGSTDAAADAALALAEEEGEEYEQSYAIFSSENWAWLSWLPRLQLEIVRRPAAGRFLARPRGSGANDPTGATRQGTPRAVSDALPSSGSNSVNPGRLAASPVPRRAVETLDAARSMPSALGAGLAAGAGRGTEPGDVVHAREMAQLREVFPHMTEGALRRALLRTGSLEQAVEVLLSM
jgi:hypothetical protein